MDQGAHSLDMIHKFTRNKDLAELPSQIRDVGEWAIMLRGSSAIATEQ